MEKPRKERNQIRSKKKKKMIEEPPPISPPIDPSSSFRNWSDLPEVLLVSILHRLLFWIPDLFAFAAVCRFWRSAAATFSSCRGSPLLLNPVVSPGRSQWSSPARCRLQTLTGCVGWSYGQLIFVPAGQNAVLTDVSTGHEIQSPGFPDGYKDFSFGILTAPLTSSSCFLLLPVFSYYRPNGILCWAPGSSSEWSVLHYSWSCVAIIISLVVFKGHVFGLTEFLDLIVVELAPMSLKEIKITMPGVKYKRQASSDTQLVECGEELLLLHFSPTYCRHGRGVGVYRLDVSKHRWVKIESLGDCCLFIDAVRKPAIACSDPTIWGARNNCIYFAEPDCDTWNVVPLDGGGLDSTGNSPFSVSNMKLSKWLSPVRVYPRFVREGVQIEGRAAFSELSEGDALVQFLDVNTEG